MSKTNQLLGKVGVDSSADSDNMDVHDLIILSRVLVPRHKPKLPFSHKGTAVLKVDECGSPRFLEAENYGLMPIND